MCSYPARAGVFSRGFPNAARGAKKKQVVCKIVEKCGNDEIQRRPTRHDQELLQRDWIRGIDIPTLSECRTCMTTYRWLLLLMSILMPMWGRTSTYNLELLLHVGWREVHRLYASTKVPLIVPLIGTTTVASFSHVRAGLPRIYIRRLERGLAASTKYHTGQYYLVSRVPGSVCGTTSQLQSPCTHRRNIVPPPRYPK